MGTAMAPVSLRLSLAPWTQMVSSLIVNPIRKVEKARSLALKKSILVYKSFVGHPPKIIILVENP
jgi:hypothetical protein